MSATARFFTVSDRRFFVGTVCLINSLRRTGNGGDVVVLDSGLTPRQRQRLSAAATVVDLPRKHSSLPHVFKPFPALLDPRGTLVFVDSDIIVTRSLDPLLERASAGEVVMFVDIHPQRERWFAEWEELFALERPPRRQPYLNAGFLAFSTDHWPDLLERWWNACQRVPPERTLGAGARSADPFCFSDQDALNAVLMSAVPRESVAAMPEEQSPSSELLPHVKVLEKDGLDCEFRGLRTYLLHYWGGPKPWERNAWMRVRRNAYVLLMPRVLYAPGAAVTIRPAELPLWLRPGPLAAVLLRVLSALNGLLRRFLDRLSFDARHRVSQFRQRLLG